MGRPIDSCVGTLSRFPERGVTDADVKYWTSVVVVVTVVSSDCMTEMPRRRRRVEQTLDAGRMPAGETK